LPCEKFDKEFHDFKVMETELFVICLTFRGRHSEVCRKCAEGIINFKCNTNANQTFPETGFQEESSRRKLPVLGSFVLKMTAIYSSTHKSV
jgi:hypothetical protein